MLCCGLMKRPLAAWLVVLSAAIVFSTPRWAAAADPALGSVSPIGGQRGTEVEVVFNGARLGDTQEVFLYYPGIEVKKLEVVNDKQVKATLAIAPDCRLGIHALRLRTATGITNLRQFSVGALPEIQEKEPNSDFDAPQPIELDRTINGVVQNEDVDYFLVEAKKGERITAEIEGIRLGVTFFDPYVAIMDMRRFELSNADDTPLVRQDAVASIIAPEDGKYVIQVRESAFGGSGACVYRLHVGRFPRPRAVFPAGGRPGETLTVRWLGDVSGVREEQITVPTAPGRRFGLFAEDPTGISPSPLPFRVNDLPNVAETEPNNATDNATSCSVPCALNGIIAEAGDVDRYRFSAKKGQVFDIHVYARRLRSPLDPVLNIYNAKGGGVAGNDDSGGPDSYVRLKIPADGDYIVQVRDQLLQGDPTYVYRVEITPVTPRLTMTLPERRQFVDITASVPRGNRLALLVNARRADFGGDIDVRFEGMPDGVAMETETMAANQSIVPVLLSAKEDAPLAGSLVDVVGRVTDPNRSIEGHLLQNTSLVRGRNNIRVWDHPTDRLAMAVTEPAPFQIEIVQPKAPLVRNGRMQLKVVAKRQEGFNAPIAVRMLYNPPGVGSSGSISIPKDKNEAVIPLSANGGAQVRTWKIAVTGESNAGNGNLLVSSQLAQLQVAEPFFGFTFQSAAVEQGQETNVVLAINQLHEFEGKAKVELLGLPNEVTAEPQEFTSKDEQVIFTVKTTEKSPPGKHKTLVARAVVMVNGEPVTHVIGSGELRIDKPLPPKKDQPAAPKPAPKPKPKPSAKPLSRLEQLRLERQRAKEAAAAAKAQAAAEAANKEAGKEADKEKEKEAAESSDQPADKAAQPAAEKEEQKPSDDAG